MNSLLQLEINRIIIQTSEIALNVILFLFIGDPVLFHAAYIVICQVRKSLDEEKLSEKLLVARCRLGTAVKKTILLASFDRTKSGTNENKIKFERLIWTASNNAEDIHTR